MEITKTEITEDNFSNLFERGTFVELNFDLTEQYHLNVEDLKYINSGSYNIVFEFPGIDGKREGFRPLIFRVSKSPFYKHKIEPETAEVSTSSRIKNYLHSYFSSQPQPQPQPKSKKNPVNSAQRYFNNKQKNVTYTELSSKQSKKREEAIAVVVSEMEKVDKQTEAVQAEIKKKTVELLETEKKILELSNLNNMNNRDRDELGTEETDKTKLIGEIKQLELDISRLQKQRELLEINKQVKIAEIEAEYGAFYESVPSFFKEEGKSHGRAYLEHLSREKIIPELISMGFFVLRLEGHFCFYEYSISEKGIGLDEYLMANKTLSENNIKTLCKGIQNILTKLVKLQIEFDIKVSNFVVVNTNQLGTTPNYVPRIIDVEIGHTSLPSIESELREMFKKSTSIEDIHTFIVMFQLFQLKLYFKHANHKNLSDFPLLSEKNAWYLNLWENNEINIISKYIQKMLYYFYYYFTDAFKFYKNKTKEQRIENGEIKFKTSRDIQKYCDNYPYYIQNLIDKNFNNKVFEDYDDNPLKKLLEAPVPVVNNGGSRTKKTKRVRKNKSKKRKNKSKKRKLII